MDIKIKYLEGQENLLKQTSKGDAIDLFTNKEVSLKKGEVKLIPLGVCMELPVGYMAKIYPRSSTPLKWSTIQANSVGIIDCEYRGEWKWMAYALQDVVIPKGTRLCQFIVEETQTKKFGKTNFDNVLSLSETTRGEGGFGSTGK